jgi:hypothetical protein
MTSEPSERPPEAADSGLLAGVDAVRGTAKWLIAAFAAIGGALIAGSQLSDLGKLSDDPGRLALALAGAVAALAGIAFAICYTAKVLLPARVLLGEVVANESGTAAGKAVQGDPSLLDGHATTIKELRDKFQASLAKYETAWQQYSAEQDPAKKDELEQKLVKVESERNTLAETLNRVRELLLFLAVKDTFSEAAKFIIGGAAFAAAGIVAFAYAAHPDEDPKSRVPELETPTRVLATLSDVKAKGLTDALGRCDLSHVPALALSGSAKQGGCNAVRLTVGGDKVAPATAVSVVAPKPKGRGGPGTPAPRTGGSSPSGSTSTPTGPTTPTQPTTTTGSNSGD